MKKASRSVFILQLIVITILGIVIYFQNSYVSLFYKDISYIDVLVSDDKAFNAFLSWTEERGIVVSRISVNTNNEIILHVSDWALSDNLVLLEGSAPERGEFVSDIITQEMNQSGIMKRLLPNYNVKIYSLYEPKQFHFTRQPLPVCLIQCLIVPVQKLCSPVYITSFEYKKQFFLF